MLENFRRLIDMSLIMKVIIDMSEIIVIDMSESSKFDEMLEPVLSFEFLT